MAQLPNKLIAARYSICRERWWIADAIWAMEPVLTDEVPSMAIDKWWRVYINPAWVYANTVEHVAGVLYHEAWHPLRGHHDRCDAMHADPVVWNSAANMEINDGLVEEGVALPPTPDLPKLHGFPDGEFAEEYYNRLVQQAGKKPKGKDKDRHGDDCGSGAGGADRPWEKGAPPRTGLDGKAEKPKPGSVPGINAARAELIRRKVAENIIEAAQRGTLPAGLDRWAKGILKSRVDWRSVLASVCRESINAIPGGFAVRSYSRPSRRAMPGILLPSWLRTIPRAAIIGDTSGSMSAETHLAQVLAEVDAVCKTTGADVTWLACDAAVGQIKKHVTSARDVSLVGGGGTDMGVGLAAAAALRPVPHVVICITDGETPWPTEAPSRATHIVVLVKKQTGYAAPSWARLVEALPEAGA